MKNKKLNKESIKEYWDSQALKYGDAPQATTLDYYMRKKEIQCIKDYIKQSNCKTIADFGCGNGFSTLDLSKSFPKLEFFGFDYSKEMIRNANKRKIKENSMNIEFDVFDLTQDTTTRKYDLIITDRCLINLSSWEDQMVAIKTIFNSLTRNGVYLMIENFVEGHNNFNHLRTTFDLPIIKIRNHNLFLEKKKVHDYCVSLFKNITYQNISSTYYIVSRVIYSKICKENNEDPDYLDIHHELASQLPDMGDYGPVYSWVLKK